MKRLIFFAIIVFSFITVKAQKLYGKVENIRISKDTSKLYTFNYPETDFIQNGILYQRPDNMPCVISHPKSNMPCVINKFSSKMPVLRFPELHSLYLHKEEQKQLLSQSLK